MRVDSGYYGASPRVQLTSDPVWHSATDSIPGIAWAAAALDTAGRHTDSLDSHRRVGPAWWADSLSDSITISFVNGFSGAVFILAPFDGTAERLAGRAEEHWDLGPTITPRGAASAVRVACFE